MDNVKFVSEYLFRQSSNYWNVFRTYDVTGLDKFTKEEWYKIFAEIQKYDLKVSTIFLPSGEWLKDFICEGDPWSINPSLAILNPDKLWGADIHFDEEIPEHLGIICSGITHMKASVLVNGNWQEEKFEIMPRISRIKYIINKMEESNEMQNA